VKTYLSNGISGKPSPSIPSLAFFLRPAIFPPVHRESLINQLKDYAIAHPQEGEVMASFMEFVVSEPECFNRCFVDGHVTGSAWVVDRGGSQVLLTHHRKLDRWLQLGGHADGDSDVLSVAFKEAEEESGLSDFTHLGSGIFDIDIHRIPARKGEPEHFHYDVRYVLRADGSTDYVVSDESHDLRWVELDDVEKLTQEASMMRMVAKWKQLKSELGESITG